MNSLIESVEQQAKERGITLSENLIDDVLTVALFDQVAWKFLENRNNPDAFEPVPTAKEAEPKEAQSKVSTDHAVYTVNVNNKAYVVQINEGADAQVLAVADSAPVAAPSAPSGSAESVSAPLAGNIWKIHAKAGQQVKEGDTLLILEAMKMETEIKAARDGKVEHLAVSEGDAVQVGDELLALA